MQRCGCSLLLLLALTVLHPVSPSLLAADIAPDISAPSRQIGPATGLTAISISIAPTAVSLTRSKARQFTATLTGTIDTRVAWSVSPSIGTIDGNGLYTAPATIPSAQTITVTATSAADTTKVAQATVNLISVSVSLMPATTTLTSSQTQPFTASVSGIGNTTVMWSLNPAIGTINNGLYTAPAAITSSQTVMVTATSVADPTESASAVISLQGPQPIAVSVSPAATTLQASQTQQFSASVTGAINRTVRWTLSPAAGTISNGLYTAPAFIPSSQTVTVTATSAADPSKSDSAQVTLQPTIAVSLNPGSASLQESQTQQFTASVTGTTIQDVTWSLSPNVGTISSSGLYTAPDTISYLQQVVVMAASTADTSKSGQATVRLSSLAEPAPVTLPVEVMGPDGTVVSTMVNAPTVPAGSNQLQMRIHGLRYETEASVQVNGSAWVPLNSATVTLLGNAAAYGGIGGGFSTLDMTMRLPAGAITPGNNTINFRFNATDGRTSGFRVLSFNFLDTQGNALVPPQAFVEEDPSTWQPPSTNSTDIAAGKALWFGADLKVPQSTGWVSIQARCASCHAQDGRDLKYFNYSNYSIRARSVFHGLTAQQGDQIASYIRTLPVNNPGRPWNPPYQPGPGLDSKPVSEWAAGAGLDAIGTDQDQFNDIFPAGIQDSVFSAKGNLNQREIRLTFQLMDWNEWLPAVHPMDSIGAAFVNSSYNTAYQTLRSTLKVGNAAIYSSDAVKLLFTAFGDGRQALWNSTKPTVWTQDSTNKAYSLPLWGLVKSWEINNEFQLEGLSQAYFGPLGNPRSWAGNFPFYSSPAIEGIPPDHLKNGKKATKNYVGFAWYHLQLILNDSNHHQSYGTPIDWGYAFGAISGMSGMVAPAEALHYEWQIRSLQIQNNGVGPQLKGEGWQWFVANPYMQLDSSNRIWVGVPQATRSTLSEGFLRSWLASASQWTPQQFYKGNFASPSQIPAHNNPLSGRFVDAMWYIIPQYRYVGVNQTLINQLADFAKTLWPLGNWEATKTAACWIQNNMTVCSTQQ